MRSLPFVLLAAVAASVLWLVFAAPDDATVPAPADQPRADAVAVREAAPQAATGAASAPTTPREEARPDAAEGRTALEVVDQGAASCLVQGRIVDRQGAPRAGVELQTEFWPSEMGDAEIERFMDLPGNRQVAGKGPVAKTGPDGRFSFTVARNRVGSIVLDGDRFAMARDQGRFDTRVGDVDLGDVTAYAPAAIAGRIVDALGQPLEGVSVMAARGPLSFGAERKAETAADGSFTIGGLRGGKWLVATRSAQHEPSQLEVTLDDEESREGLLIQVGRGRAISGIVVDDRGVGVEGALVGSYRKQDVGGMELIRFAQEEAVKTDKDGRFELGGFADAAVTLRATRTGHATATERGVMPGRSDLVLRLSRLAAVEGTLRDGAGNPIAGSSVRVRAQRPAQAMPIEVDGASALEIEMVDAVELGEVPEPGGWGPFHGPGTARTAEDGSFRVEGVEPGTIEVTAKGQTHLPVVRGGLQVAPGQTLGGIALVATTGAVALVRVTDEDGNAVAGAKVMLQRPPAQSAGNVVMRSVAVEIGEAGPDLQFGGGQGRIGGGVTDEQGIARIGGLPAGPVVVRADHVEFAPAIAVPLNLPALGEVEAALTLRTPGAAQLFVSDAAGNAVACDYVVRGPLGGQERSRSRDGQTASDGKALVESLAPGEYEASLRLPAKGQDMGGGIMIAIGGGGRSLPGTQVRFLVARGETTQVDLRRPSLAVVRGQVTGPNGPAADVEVELHGATSSAALQDLVGGDMESLELADLPGMARQSARTDASGAYELSDVPAGRYELRFGASGQPVKDRAAVEVREGEVEVVQDLRLRTGSLRIVAVDEAGDPIEGVQVEVEAARSGDVTREQRVVVAASIGGDGDDGFTGMSFGGGKRIRTDVDGEAMIENLPPGSYVVKLSHRRFAKREVRDQTIVENAQTDCGRVTMAPAGSVSGRILDADGNPVRMALVTCRKEGDAAQDAERKPAMNGAFRFTGLAPGRYELRARPLEGGSEGEPVMVDVTAGARANDVQVRVGR